MDIECTKQDLERWSTILSESNDRIGWFRGPDSGAEMTSPMGSEQLLLGRSEDLMAWLLRHHRDRFYELATGAHGPEDAFKKQLERSTIDVSSKEEVMSRKRPRSANDDGASSVKPKPRARPQLRRFHSSYTLPMHGLHSASAPYFEERPISPRSQPSQNIRKVGKHEEKEDV